ncbi:14 kDa transcription factor [uncultured Clostridium sp.]|nr:14 kDa transcription factor [uncultured Clostridium sp.]
MSLEQVSINLDVVNIANSLAWDFYKTNSKFTFDEIQSAAYMGAVKGMKSFKENQGKKLTSWVYSKVKWEILDMFEKDKKFKYISLYEADDNYSLEERIGTDEFEEDLLNQVLIKKALTTLNAEEIKLVYLRFYDRLSYSEIADIMRISRNTATIKLQKSLEKMRNKLNEKEVANELKIPVRKNNIRKVEAINTTKDYIVMRTKAEALYIIDNQSTLRDTAKAFGVNRSTIHKDLTKRLPKLDRTLFNKVCKILDYNFEIKAYRGGEATRRNYNKKAYSSTDQSMKNKH